MKRRFPIWALLSGVAGIVGIIAMLVFTLASEYQSDSQQARLEAENITRVLEEHAISVFKITDLLLREVQRNVRCLLYTSPSPRDGLLSRMPSSA